MAGLVKTYVRQEIVPFKLVLEPNELAQTFGDMVENAINQAIKNNETLQEVSLQWEQSEWNAYVTSWHAANRTNAMQAIDDAIETATARKPPYKPWSKRNSNQTAD